MDKGATAAATASRPIARVQGRVLAVLQSGERLTALQIARRARVTDPRGAYRSVEGEGHLHCRCLDKVPGMGDALQGVFLIGRGR